MSSRARLIHLRMEKATDLLQYREWTISMIVLRLYLKITLKTDGYRFRMLIITTSALILIAGFFHKACYEQAVHLLEIGNAKPKRKFRK